MVRIAVIPGDGVGKEVIPEGQVTLEAAAKAHRFDVEFTYLDWGTDRYLREGRAMPEDGLDYLRGNFDAVYLGCIGDRRVPGSVVVEQVLLAIRFGLDLYANFRPCRLYHEDLTPLKGVKTGEIDHVVFRENTEGLFVNVGGFFKRGTKNELAIQEEVHTYKGVERVIRAAFSYARRHGRRKVTMADKGTGLRFQGGIWQRIFDEVHAEFSEIEAENRQVDAVAMGLIREPRNYDVIVTNNMFGDILSDITSSLVGGVGIAPSANLNLDGLSMFEPVHGSGLGRAGKGIANPVAAILTAALLLDHLGCAEGAASIRRAVEEAIAGGARTVDLGGDHNTRACGEAIRKRLG